jgi:hypothetical protein
VSGEDEIIAQLSLQLDEQLDAAEPAVWGEEIKLAVGEKFFGRYLGEELSPETDRAVFLLLAPDEGVNDAGASTVPVFIRERTTLRSEVDKKQPKRGDIIGIGRGTDGTSSGSGNAYHRYAVTPVPCDKPLPEPASDDIPY